MKERVKKHRLAQTEKRNKTVRYECKYMTNYINFKRTELSS